MSDPNYSPKNTDSTDSFFGSLITASTGSLTTSSNAHLVYDNTSLGTYWPANGQWVYDAYQEKNVNPLQSMDYTIHFSEDKNNHLSKNVRGVRKNKLIFNCDYDGNRIQPYEHIMKLIKEKVKMSVKIKVSDVLTICYTNLQFKEITNNINFNGSCDFSTLKVKFKYGDVLYENHQLSDKELRTDKLKKIMKNE